MKHRSPKGRSLCIPNPPRGSLPTETTDRISSVSSLSVPARRCHDPRATSCPSLVRICPLFPQSCLFLDLLTFQLTNNNKINLHHHNNPRTRLLSPPNTSDISLTTNNGSWHRLTKGHVVHMKPTVGHALTGQSMFLNKSPTPGHELVDSHWSPHSSHRVLGHGRSGNSARCGHSEGKHGDKTPRRPCHENMLCSFHFLVILALSFGG